VKALLFHPILKQLWHANHITQQQATAALQHRQRASSTSASDRNSPSIEQSSSFSGHSVRRRHLQIARIRTPRCKKESVMDSSFEGLLRLFDAKGYKYHANHELKMVTAGFQGRNCKFLAHFKLDEKWDLLQVFAAVPVIVPAGCRPAIAETIARANFGMRLGKFEMDFSDGELRFQIANFFSEQCADENILHQMVGAAVGTMDRYFPAIMAVIYANELPCDAVQHVEQGRR
jgi:hypothetical protein